jgi:two-component system sensor histidine kinase KdpD
MPHLYNFLTSFFLYCGERIDAVLSARIRAAALILLASVFLVGFGMTANRHLNLAAAISVYLLVTLAIARKTGFAAASIVSVVATLSLEYYFAPPLFSFRVDRPENWIALATFEGVSLMVSRLSDRAREDQLMLEEQGAAQKALYEFSRDLLLLDWKQSPERQLCMLIKRCFRLEGVALWNAYEGSMSGYGVTPDADEAAKAVYFSERNYDDASHRSSYRVLYFGTRAVGSLALYVHSLDALTINSIASIAAMAIERTRSLALEMTVEAERHSEQLRSALLDGLAHAFKTPLTTITLSSSGLLAAQGLSEQQTGLISLINREATRLGDLTTRLLHMSQLEPSRFILREREINLKELLQQVLDECALPLESRQLDVRTAPEAVKIRCDPQMLGLALVQIVDNAAKYAPQDSRIDISVARRELQIVMRIHNEGSYIPPEERQKVFTRFYRSPSVDHRAPGTGLGLSIAMKAVEAHGGKISIESDAETGTTFVVSIPNGAKALP